MKKMLASLGQLFFPNVCVCCAGSLSHQEVSICDLCLYTLPKMEDFDSSKNFLIKKFWGHVNLKEATALYSLTNSDDVLQVVHHIKYKANFDLAVEMGKRLGQRILSVKGFGPFDGIVPVPLHPKKHHARGYNQCDLICKGISVVLGSPVLKESVDRIKYNPSQTKKARYDRFLNAQEIFKVSRPNLLKGKRILLVDDVITTGATIGACANAILDVEGTKVWVCSLAVGR